jgi:hypothetical protein|tara:strand:- start:654 stop:758 length:105 start_codon:yes stop_codon:yes gene_type:complete
MEGYHALFIPLESVRVFKPFFTVEIAAESSPRVK